MQNEKGSSLATPHLNAASQVESNFFIYILLRSRLQTIDWVDLNFLFSFENCRPGVTRSQRHIQKFSIVHSHHRTQWLHDPSARQALAMLKSPAQTTSKKIPLQATNQASIMPMVMFRLKIFCARAVLVRRKWQKFKMKDASCRNIATIRKTLSDFYNFMLNRLSKLMTVCLILHSCRSICV